MARIDVESDISEHQLAVVPSYSGASGSFYCTGPFGALRSLGVLLYLEAVQVRPGSVFVMQSSNHIYRLIAQPALLLAAGVVSGCFGVEETSVDREGVSPQIPNCLEVSTLSTPEAPIGPNGLSMQAYANALKGQNSAPLRWWPDRPELRGASQMFVEYDGSIRNPRFTRSKVNPDHPKPLNKCFDRAQFDATVVLRTEDGRINATIPMVVSAELPRPDIADFQAELGVALLGGSFMPPQGTSRVKIGFTIDRQDVAAPFRGYMVILDGQGHQEQPEAADWPVSLDEQESSEISG